MLKFILFVLAGAVIYVLFSYVLRLFNVTIQNWRIDYHVSFPYLRAKLKT